ncbi:hypothetical protein HK104_001926, partial [Borealophlyctis nickersoniae]
MARFKTGGNNGGVIFLNSAARTADGGVNAMTVRNETGGALRLLTSPGGATGAMGLTLAATTGNATFDGTLTVSATQDSTSATTGALVVAGGVGIAKSLKVGTTITCTSLSQTSDKNLKEDITDLDNTYGFINALRPDILAVCRAYKMPEDLVKQESDGYYSLDYSQLLAPMIRCQQGLFDMIVTLMERVAKLE